MLDRIEVKIDCTVLSGGIVDTLNLRYFHLGQVAPAGQPDHFERKPGVRSESPHMSNLKSLVTTKHERDISSEAGEEDAACLGRRYMFG